MIRGRKGIEYHHKKYLWTILAAAVLKKLSGSSFKVLRFKFVIHRGRIYFGRRSMRITRSRSRRFPASKGYYSFRFSRWTYYLHFYSTGMKIYATHGSTIIKRFLRIKHHRASKGNEPLYGQSRTTLKGIMQKFFDIQRGDSEMSSFIFL